MIKINKKTKSILKETLDGIGISIEVGPKVVELCGFKTRDQRIEDTVNAIQSTLEDLHQSMDSPSKDLNAVYESQQIFRNQFVKDFIGDDTVQHFKDSCNLVINQARQGNPANSEQIDYALNLFKTWIRNNHPSENLLDRYKAFENPSKLIPILKNSNPTAYRELMEMLPLLEEIRKYKSES